MKILHVISSANPAGGGPIEGVRNLGQRMLELGHTSELVTMDDPAAPWVQKHPQPVHALGPVSTNYGLNRRLLPWLRLHATHYDFVIVNGIWQYHSFATWRALTGLKRPYAVFTHGMLDPWFKRTYPLKHLKKWLYWPWAEYRVLRDASAVLFTCEDERLLARESFWLYRAREQVVTYGTRPPPNDKAALAARFFAEYPALQGKRVLLFLSRIQEKKGCDLLISAFADVARQTPDLQLVMAGPDQSGWMAALKAQAAQLGVADRIHWPGMLQGDIKWGAFHAAEAFVLPSHQENFGIAVAEALGCGLPVLISNKVNIWREIDNAGAGLVADDTVEGTRSLLTRWLALEPAARADMSRAASQLFNNRFTVSAMAASLLRVIDPINAKSVP
ncbi:glycosyltransferase [Hydrogenophaga sp. PBL-H3]|uniref:glycosyltransferase n=1 Tax=Hydrogenophaga sp. PBL-H3 TaxID=434010 RepID=UPI00131F8AC5|nr:glycosyltransferase [Hydrogenophaga sp. PBL-H3]QHE75921.1 glycosyltransferase [Hydrogenophaga sp. PBL-H3]QHE80345.1 glycosyltransferase [Hydrogenophaga sp. PBL-H3]